MSYDFSTFELHMAIVDEAYENGLTPALESLSSDLGLDISEEGLIDGLKRIIRRIQLRMNDAYAGITYLKDQQLRDIGQAHEEGANSTGKLPLGKVASLCYLLNPIIWLGSFSFQQKGQDRIRKAYENKGHDRQHDALVKRIAGLPASKAASELRKMAEQSLQSLKKLQHELQTNKNLTPDEAKMISKAVNRAAALNHRR